MKGTHRLVDRTYAYKAGTSGTVVIPSNGTVTSWSAHTSTNGATVTINGGDSIPMPSVSVGGDPEEGVLVGPTFVFTGTDAYYIEYFT